MDGRTGFIIICNSCGGRTVVRNEDLDRSEWKIYKPEDFNGEIFIEFGNAGGYGFLAITCLRCKQELYGSE